MKGIERRVLPFGMALAVLVAAVHLGWEVAHGGVKSHHLLANNDLPAFSNWWGLLVLPLLGWLGAHSVTIRVRVNEGAFGKAMAGFSGAVLVGVALAASFAEGYESATSVIFYGALASGLVAPIYRGEYLFGFVLGMTFVFGSVLPTIVGSVVAGISAVAHFLVRPAFAMLVRKMRG